MALEFAVVKAVVHEGAHEFVRRRECDEARAHVAGREYPEFVTENAGRAPAVRHRDNGSQIVGVFLEAGQHGKGARPAPYNHDIFTFFGRHMVRAIVPEARPLCTLPVCGYTALYAHTRLVDHNYFTACHFRRTSSCADTDSRSG